MICENCNQEHDGSYGSGRFCSQRCAKAFSTKYNRKIANEKIKETFKKKQELRIQEYYKNPKICIICNNVIPYNKRKRICCSEECHKIRNRQILIDRGKQGGKKSANNQQRRSKNEIAFCNKCEEYFGKENVLHNESIFNGWDADIILPQYKLAILWNGPWHYKQIAKQQSLLQIQSRDKLKVKEIIKCNYIPYIIKDMGKYNIDKVNYEFNLLLDYLKISE